MSDSVGAFRIVTFYVDPPDVKPLTTGELSGQRQTELLYQSARQVCPGVQMTILTCPSTDLSSLSFPFQRVDREVNRGRIMNERACMQRDFIDSYDFSLPLIFLDTDMLLSRDLSDIFDGEFDVGLTYRPSNLMPINGGALFVSNKRPSVVQQFFKLFVESLEGQTNINKLWYGDQYALLDVSGVSSKKLAGVLNQEYRGVRFRLFPSLQFNFTPKRSAFRALSVPPDVRLLHFKGNRRPMMLPTWQFSLARNSEHGAGLWARLTGVVRLFAVLRVFDFYLRKDRRRRIDTQYPTHSIWREWAALAGRLCLRIGLETRQVPCATAIVTGGSNLVSAVTEINRDAQVRLVDMSLNTDGLLNCSQGDIPQSWTGNIMILLGVLEFFPEPERCLRHLAERFDWLILSFPASDLSRLTKRQMRHFGWRFSARSDELETLVTASGYEILERRMPSDEGSVVVLCRRT